MKEIKNKMKQAAESADAGWSSHEDLLERIEDMKKEYARELESHHATLKARDAVIDELKREYCLGIEEMVSLQQELEVSFCKYI